mmetsp:Transcript_1747/g.3863  ORF Transcript_1747/g.3863 Transcript_1747/m.3863 type:complete len:250 (+) Transcript_1747:104-853(+)
MQRLRRKDPTGPDIESGTAAGGGPQSSPTPTSRTSPSRSALPPHNAVRAGGGTNGAGKFVTLLRKICLLTADDGRNPHGWVITIIKDVISGTILGVFFLMVLIFLDYRNIIQLGSARAFRKAAFELMTDPDTVRTIEENIDVKFIPIEVYDNMQKEIAKSAEMVGGNTSLQQHETDLADKRKQLEGLRDDYELWKSKGDTILGMDKWCGSCKGGWGNCDNRVRYLADTYHTPEIKARVDIMKDGKCIKG